MKGLSSIFLALVCAACAASRADSNEPVPGPRVAMTRLVRTHEPRPADETAEATSACEAGDLAMCHAAALDAYYAPPTPESNARARALFEKACAKGYAPSCNGLGVLHEAGRGVTKDPAAAVLLFRQSCEKDASTGCRHLANALRTGRGVAKDPAAADRADERAKCLFEGSLTKDPASCPSLDEP